MSGAEPDNVMCIKPFQFETCHVVWFEFAFSGFRLCDHWTMNHFLRGFENSYLNVLICEFSDFGSSLNQKRLFASSLFIRTLVRWVRSNFRFACVSSRSLCGGTFSLSIERWSMFSMHLRDTWFLCLDLRIFRLLNCVSVVRHECLCVSVSFSASVRIDHLISRWRFVDVRGA